MPLRKLIIFQLLLFYMFYCQNIYSQIFSEAEVKVIGNKTYTNMLYIKFRNNGALNYVNNNDVKTGADISEKYSGVKNVFTKFCEDNGANMNELKITKAFPSVNEADTLFNDPITHTAKKLPKLTRVYIVRFKKDVPIQDIIAELKASPDVEYAHGPVQYVNCSGSTPVRPNDTYFQNGNQWYLDSIRASYAWGITTGSSNIKVAAVDDTGVELTHSELTGQIYGGDNNPAGVTATHGTSVAGFIAAHTNNTSGIASLGWNLNFMPYQNANENENRTILANKIIAAVDAGAKVINLSLKTLYKGLTSCDIIPLAYNNRVNEKNKSNSIIQVEPITYYYNYSYEAVENAIDYALVHNVVVVAVAGNSAESYDMGKSQPCEEIPYPCYPAQYPGVIAVSGSYKNNNFVDVWNYGSFVSVNAPGANNVNDKGIFMLSTNNGYTWDWGTSFAAPQVAALAGLLKSLNPDYEPAVIKDIIEQSAEKVGQYSYTNGRNDYMGYGRINAYRALMYAQRNNTFTNQMNMLANLPISYSDSKYNGAAAVKMMLYYLNKPDKTLSEIYSAGGGTSPAPMNAANVKNALTSLATGYNWTAYSNSSRDEVMNPLIKWLSYDYYNYTPPKTKQYTAGYVPLNGATYPFTDWVAVSGVSLSKNPWNGPNYDATGMTVNGFWVTRPTDSMGGGDSYYNTNVFYSYFQTINGEYHGVVDPPSEKIYPIISGEPIKLNLVNKSNIIQELSDNLLPKLKQHKKFVEIFESLQFYEETTVTNLTTNGGYTIINIGKDKKTEAGIVVDNITSELLEVNVPPAPVYYVLLSSAKAIDILAKNKTLDKTDLDKAVPKLVYAKEYCPNYYYPLWEIAVNDKKYYVSQDEKVIEANIQAAPAITEKTEVSVTLQNYPNPFNPVTQIKFALSAPGHVRLEVFDMLGRRITTLIDEEKQAGSYSVPFNGSNLPSGIYLCRITAGSKVESMKMLLLK